MQKENVACSELIIDYSFQNVLVHYEWFDNQSDFCLCPDFAIGILWLAKATSADFPDPRCL